MRTAFQYLRLMRFPLVFTAIGDGWAVRWMGDDLAGRGRFALPPIAELATLMAISAGLYGLGMVLNDVMDARRDPPGKPITSGAVGRGSANLLACAFGFTALAMAGQLGVVTLSIVMLTTLMIVAYDTGLKRFPFAGLLLLGLIRAVQCQVSAVSHATLTAPLWNSLFLFSHVTIVSWIAYGWENKQPAIRLTTRWALAFAVVLIDTGLFDAFDLGRVWLGAAGGSIRAWRFLAFPIAAAGVYLVALFWILVSPRYPTGPDKGRMAMRLGLMWLLVYDAAFCAAAGRYAGAIAMAALLALTILSSRAMMAWGRRPAPQTR